jgi:hypothetical protein
MVAATRPAAPIGAWQLVLEKPADIALGEAECRGA